MHYSSTLNPKTLRVLSGFHGSKETYKKFMMCNFPFYKCLVVQVEKNNVETLVT
jgi:hypothetical protein